MACPFCKKSADPIYGPALSCIRILLPCLDIARQIVQRVLIHAADAHLVVQVCAGGRTGRAGDAQHRALGHHLPLGDLDGAHVGIQRGQAAAVVHHHVVAVAAAAVVAALKRAAGQDDLAAFDGKDGAIVKS